MILNILFNIFGRVVRYRQGKERTRATQAWALALSYTPTNKKPFFAVLKQVQNLRI